MKNVTVETLHQLLAFNRESGKLFWRQRPRQMFSDNRSFNTWNTRYADKEAFTATDATGYKVGRIFGSMYLAHRVIYALVQGEWPICNIDHINGNFSDNRIINLRDVNQTENMRNMRLPSNNASGNIGVSWSKAKNKWRVYAIVKYKQKHLGYYDDLESAVNARKKADVDLGFHRNHGELR